MSVFQRPIDKDRLVEWEFYLSRAASLARRKRRAQELHEREQMLRWVAIAICYIGAMVLIFGTGWYR